MSVVITPPDPKGALLTHLRGNAAVLSVINADQIRGTMPSKSRTPNGFYLTVVAIPGGGADADLPRSSTVFEVRAYGSTGYNAMKLSRAVQSALIPLDRHSYGFTHNGCRIYDVRMRVGHAEFREPGYDGEGDWEMRRSVYELFYWDTPVE